MLVKIFGVMDIIAGLILIFEKNMSLSNPFLIIIALILIAKACLGLLKGLASWIDLSAGVIFLLLTIISIPPIIGVIIGLLLIQKGIFSFL